MRNITTTIIFAIAVLVSACGDSAKTNFSIKGKYPVDLSEDKQLVLMKYDQGQATPMDTVELDDEGNFEFKGNVSEPTFTFIDMGDRKGIFLFLDSGENVTIDATPGQFISYTVEGSKTNKQIKELIDIHNKYYLQLMQANEQAMNQYGDAQSIPPDEFSRIQAMMMSLEEQRTVALAEYMKNAEPSYAPFMAVSVLIPQPSFEVVDVAYNKLNEFAPESKFVTSMTPIYNRMKVTAEGSKATAVGTEMPEITLPNPDGEMVNISSLEGKYVLVDFWASWCKPCRQENPNNVNIYNKYKDKGFEIVGISLDEKKPAWTAAIEQDGLPWIHLSDLKGWNTPLTQQFGFDAIPFTVLVSPEGKIIDRGLRGAQLEARLNELLN